MVKHLFSGNIPRPFRDENCYSILCRYAVRRGLMSSSQICIDLFGHNEPLKGYLFKPFRMKDLEWWYRGKDFARPEYGACHSSCQFYSVFLGSAYAEMMRESHAGSIMTPGQAKRINRECGFTRSHKQNLWYCPECVKDDFTRYGETCWRRLPQMPGAEYCPVHGVKLRESGVQVSDINYQVLPATYALIHFPEPEPSGGNVYAARYMGLAADIAWLLENGYSIAGREWVSRSFIKAVGHPIHEGLVYTLSNNMDRKNRFEDYLVARILRECGKNKITPEISRQLGMILSIEETFGSLEAFCRA